MDNDNQILPPPSFIALYSDARRLSTVMERLLDEVSFNASNLAGETVLVDAPYVESRLAELSKNEDLSRYIL